MRVSFRTKVVICLVHLILLGLVSLLKWVGFTVQPLSLLEASLYIPLPLTLMWLIINLVIERVFS